MKSSHSLAARGLAAMLLTTGLPAIAGEGHDHGNTGSAAHATGTALPRFAASSETFELVGVLDGKQLTLYLDRFADNAPVPGALIELEIAGVKSQARATGDAYEVVLDKPPQSGVLPISATVAAGSRSELLSGELDLHEATLTDPPTHVHGWQEVGGWAAGGLAALAVLVFGVRRLMAARSLRAGGAA